MPDALPIACSLLPDDLARRLDDIAALGAAALLETRRHGTHAELRFAADAGVRERVTAIAAAESACCPFFAMDVSDEPDLVVLTVDAPSDAEPVLDELVAGFARRSAAVQIARGPGADGVQPPDDVG